MIWYTSDTHFGHRRIIELCQRPFRDTDHMNSVLANNWNSVVHPDDPVFHLGDVALGPIEAGLEVIGRLNGDITLVLGNHDRPFMAKNPVARADWTQRYLDAGFSAVVDSIEWPRFNMSHFPYDGDSHDGDRFTAARLADSGVPLIHGHTHAGGNPVSFSRRGTLQVHVGQDAWNYTPVAETQVTELLAKRYVQAT